MRRTYCLDSVPARSDHARRRSAPDENLRRAPLAERVVHDHQLRDVRFGARRAFRILVAPGRRPPANPSYHRPLCSFSLSIWMLAAAAERIPFSFDRVGREPFLQLVCFLLLYLVVLAPFFFGGLCICRLFSQASTRYSASILLGPQRRGGWDRDIHSLAAPARARTRADSCRAGRARCLGALWPNRRAGPWSCSQSRPCSSVLPTSSWKPVPDALRCTTTSATC